MVPPDPDSPTQWELGWQVPREKSVPRNEQTSHTIGEESRAHAAPT